MPQGGKEHFIRKTSGIITSYYQIALIKNTDRQSGRAIVEQFNMKLAQKSALMYEATAFTRINLQSCLSLPKGLAEQTDYTENNTDYHCQIW